MPSAEHETPIALAKANPSVVAWFLTNVFNLQVPDCHRSHSHPTEVQVIVPRTYHADCVTVFSDTNDKPLIAAVFEVQRKRDPAKLRTWKLYVAQLEAELEVDVALLVYCPKPATARWYNGLLDSKVSSIILRPFIFTPDDVPLIFDVEVARSNLPLATFSLIVHGDKAVVDEMFPVLAEALRSIGPQRATAYYDIVLAGLPLPARLRWEAFMTSVADKYHSEVFREIAERNFAEGEAEGQAKGKAEGKAEGEAQAVLTVLEARGIAVPAEVREQILGCIDLVKLDICLRRALVVHTADEVLRD
jgi:hypothetical protein